MIIKKTVAIDMDGVLVDVGTHFINWYERDYGVKISKEKLFSTMYFLITVI